MPDDNSSLQTAPVVAVCVVLVTTNPARQCAVTGRWARASAPLFAGTTRRQDHSAWGLPGGKVDPGEDAVTAACREAREETGVVIAPADCVEVFRRPAGYAGVCACFHAKTWQGEPSRQPGEPPCGWVDVAPLALVGPFKDYNRALFKAVAFEVNVATGAVGLPRSLEELAGLVASGVLSRDPRLSGPCGHLGGP